ncbi:uncharacterized protein LOC141908649 isoform X1 [Tubulanus polymorphus]|uniref:uncharacterized protein LOC141908649 isoform X1 n=1 Tax=Tubulanus polymorphus TaxID=672921 RepID=UPI003DA33801
MVLLSLDIPHEQLISALSDQQMTLLDELVINADEQIWSRWCKERKRCKAPSPERKKMTQTNKNNIAQKLAVPVVDAPSSGKDAPRPPGVKITGKHNMNESLEESSVINEIIIAAVEGDVPGSDEIERNDADKIDENCDAIKLETEPHAIGIQTIKREFVEVLHEEGVEDSALSVEIVNQGVFICTICHRQYKTAELLEIHSHVHTYARPYKCHQCDFAFSNKHFLARHKLIHSGEKPFQCSYCEKTFSRKWHLKAHTRIHTGEKYKCRYCDKQFTHHSMYQKHEKDHTGPFFQCEVCNKTFVLYSHLKIHFRTHSKESHLCDICGKSICTKNELQRHKKRVHRVDAENNPISESIICEYCGQAFMLKRDLTVHMKRHLGQLLPCTVCDVQCLNQSRLNRHMLSHSNERSYKCKNCPKTFKHRAGFVRHVKTVHQTQRELCPMCQSSFASTDSLKRHLNRVHKVVEVDKVLEKQKLMIRELEQQPEGDTPCEVEEELEEFVIPAEDSINLDTSIEQQI